MRLREILRLSESALAAGVRCCIPFSKNCRLQCDLEHHIHTSRITSYRKGAYIIANPLQPVLRLEKVRQGTDAATDGHVSGCYVTEQPGRGRGGPDRCRAHTALGRTGKVARPPRACSGSGFLAWALYGP